MMSFMAGKHIGIYGICALADCSIDFSSLL